MNSELIMIIFCLHLIGDYYLQTPELSEQKKTNIKSLFRHILIYSLIILFINIFYKNVLYLSFVLAGAHALIDILFFLIRKLYASKSQKSNQNFSENNLLDFKLYLIDQSLHLITIMLIAYVLFEKDMYTASHTRLLQNVSSFLVFYNVKLYVAIKVCLLILVIHKPVNVFITLFLKIFSTEEIVIEKSQQEIQAGSYIGTFERIIIVILIYLKQFSAIGLVLTAKSITRHKKIVEEPSFGEYYLLGTLLSFILVILISLTILKIR